MADTATLTLTKFLKARIVADLEFWTTARDYGLVMTLNGSSAIPPPSFTQRMVIDAEAKLRIVELHSDGMTATGRYDAACHVDGYGLPSPDDCYTLRILATAYADHPDCREEWRA